MEIKSLINGYRDELLDRLGKLIAINSVESEALEDAPFGVGPKEALVAALKMLEDDGFQTKNLDHYAGYAEMGEGEQLIGIIGHLDVVPANQDDGWNSNPFEMVEKDGVLYGRGVSDDKGAVVASMIAMKVIRDLNVPLNKRIRLIMGTNEETGSKCLDYYVEKEGHVDYGFTPDGEFPGVNGEKGMIGGTYRCMNTKLLAAEGGQARNIVCNKAMVKVEHCSYSAKVLNDFFHNHNIEAAVVEEADGDVITVFGKAAHASLPHLGVNAISYLLVGLKEAGYQDNFVDYYCSHFGLHTDGEGLCKCSDEYGDLTLNCGVLRMKDGAAEVTIDIRFPVTLSSKQVLRMIEEQKEDGEITIQYAVEPLFFPPDSPLVTSLLSAYQEVTGDVETPTWVIGGGTYAKGIQNTIAFGCAFPNRDYKIHDANEFVGIDELLLQAEIYVHAIMKLLEI